MPYSTLVDLQRRTSTIDIARLTDDTGGETTDSAKVTAAIADADALIDSYLRGRYELPLTGTLDPILVTLSADLAIANLRKRRNGATDENAVQAYKSIIAMLQDIKSGKLVLATDPAQPEADPGASHVRTNCRTRVYTDDLLSTIS